MFRNIGGKIKALAKVLCWIGIAACVITGFILCGNRHTETSGVIVLFVGPILAWLSSFVLCGFGELVEAAAETRDILKRVGSRGIGSVETNTWKCPHCGQENTNVSSQCKGCGQYRS